MDDDKLFEDETERPRIKVTDRRKFAADGTPLDTATNEADRGNDEVREATADAAEPTEASTEAAGADRAAGTEDDGQDGDETNTEEPAVSLEEPPRIAAPQSSIEDLPRDFSAFVEGMYLEAMLYMGAIPDPRSGETIEDAELAKYKIDLLGMLQEKTDGNLAPEEKQQLEETLYQLRMIFVQKTQAIDS